MRSQIIGLLEIKNHRGLRGAALDAWIIESLELLLRAELERQEKKHATRRK